MSTHDDDIDFDFFDDRTQEASQGPAAAPTPARRTADGRGGPRRPRSARRTGFTPLLRLSASSRSRSSSSSCSSSGRRAARATRSATLRDYMAEVGQIGQARRRSAATSPSADDAGAEAGRARDRARRPRPAASSRPSTARRRSTRRARCARDEHCGRGARVPRRRPAGLRDTFMRPGRRARRTRRRPASCSPTQAERLLASDVVWDDLFRAPALADAEGRGHQRRRRCPRRCSSRPPTLTSRAR